MPPTNLQHRRTHNLLLISKLLNQRDAASPFTLVLDSLEQSGKPLLGEYLKRAQAAKVQTIFVSFETLRPPRNVDVFVQAWSQTQQAWQREVATHTKPSADGKRNLLIFDSLNSLASTAASTLSSLLSSFINPSTSLLALYHIDVALSGSAAQDNPYSPRPLMLLKYLATTVFTMHAIHHVLAQKAARDRSLPEPSFGLEEGIEGVIQAIGANGREGCVLEMEHRRRSGRGVREWYFLPNADVVQPTTYSASATQSKPSAQRSKKEIVILLEDHPQYRTEPEALAAPSGDMEESRTTFELGLTEKQRQDRDGVVLPYFDAQQGGYDGGRILYDMGSEDDFDEEEDEI